MAHLIKSKTVRIENASLQRDKGRLVVWWYGRIVKNTREATTPLVEVCFRRLEEGSNVPTAWIFVDIALTMLGLLRIGSVWEEGVSNKRIDYPEEDFETLDFSEDGWHLTSPSEEQKKGRKSLFSEGGYQLHSPWDQSFLIDFQLPGEKRLLVPCMEFFTRYYGNYAELRRVLATYPWHEVEGRLFMPLEDPIVPGTWPVKLAWKMGKEDAVFLAHIRYSDYTRNAAMKIYAQAESAFSVGGKKPSAILKVQPWFRGIAQLRVKGIWLEDGKTFLALRIVGKSQPKGETVVHDRERRDDLGRPEGEEGAVAGSHVRNVRQLPHIIDLTSNEAPDRGSLPIDIEDDEIAILGDPREVIDRKTAIRRGLVRKKFDGEIIRAASTGEPSGSGKGVGYGAIRSPIVLESHGMLRDMWDTMCKLQEQLPTLVRSVGWFTFDDGVSYDSEPKLISLDPFAVDDTDVANDARNWVYWDRESQIPRGILMIQAEAGEKTVCMVEIQRRQVLKKDDEGEEQVAEESFSGLVFLLKHEDDFSELASSLLEQIRRKKGIASNVADALGWAQPVFAFKHVPARGDSYLCEPAVRNALRKVGIIVPKLNLNEDNP